MILVGLSRARLPQQAWQPVLHLLAVQCLSVTIRSRWLWTCSRAISTVKGLPCSIRSRWRLMLVDGMEWGIPDAGPGRVAFGAARLAGRSPGVPEDPGGDRQRVRLARGDAASGTGARSGLPRHRRAGLQRAAPHGDLDKEADAAPLRRGIRWRPGCGIPPAGTTRTATMEAAPGVARRALVRSRCVASPLLEPVVFCHTVTEEGNMTSLIAWVGADSRGPASLNIASDSRISWMSGESVSHHWDQGKKIFASMRAPLIVGYVGDVLFPTLVLPGVIDRIDRQVFRTDGATVEGLVSVIRREWRDYPREERRPLNIYIGHRVGDGMSAGFRLTRLANQDGGSDSWQTSDVPVSPASNCLAVDGSGRRAIKKALEAWRESDAGGTSRSIFSGFVDAVVAGVDPGSGGSPQLASLYRIGAGRLLGIIHQNQRYFAGMHLIGDEAVQDVEWRNELFERADGYTKSRLADAQPQPRPSTV
jgi:hypothetical protein